MEVLLFEERELGQRIGESLEHDELLKDAPGAKQRAMDAIDDSDLRQERKDHLRKLVRQYLTEMLEDASKLQERGCEDEELRTYIEQLTQAVNWSLC